MKRTIVITGGKGFIGRNLEVRLRDVEDVDVRAAGRDTSEDQLAEWLTIADCVVHLAGENRPPTEEGFTSGNVEFTRWLCARLTASGLTPHLLFASSIQADRDNPYGRSKRQAEGVLSAWAAASGARLSIFRLKNVFGKWCRPDYNSVVATFCHRIAHDLPITVHDPSAVVELVHVDDVVEAIIAEMEVPGAGVTERVEDTMPATCIALGDLAGRIQAYREMPRTLQVPDFSERFNQQLYATYLSYVDPEEWNHELQKRSDPRGDLAEFIKSRWFGQVFVSRTHPGITRGNHYHHTKTEKFLVVAGEAVISFRHIDGREIIEHRVRGEDYRVVDIPPGYTHAITNVGDDELITLFWASEPFDPDRPDTYFAPVQPAAGAEVQ